MEPIVRILFNECCHYTENSKKKKTSSESFYTSIGYIDTKMDVKFIIYRCIIFPCIYHT